MNTTLVSQSERDWVLNRQVLRLTDNKEVQIYPMGAERFLSSCLKQQQLKFYPIQEAIRGKNILTIPAHGNSSFLFAQAGARSIHAYDQDPVTIAWMKVFKKYYHFREAKNLPSIGELLDALTQWYPPRLRLAQGNHLNWIKHALCPNALRRTYVHYLVHLAQTALKDKDSADYELEADLTFHTGSLQEIIHSGKEYDTAFIPYLLGVKNGIEQQSDVIDFIYNLIKQIPCGVILVTPSQTTRDFYLFGKRYLETLHGHNLSELKAIKKFLLQNDDRWFRAQGLAVFTSKNPTNKN